MRSARSAAICAALLVAGCGGAGHPRRRSPSEATVCTTASREAMAGLLRTAVASVGTSVSIGNNAMPQCSYSVRLPRGALVEVTANVDSSPSPYFVLERKIVESAQIFSGQRLSPAPVAVALGLEASWFPAQHELDATDGYRLISASVAWGGARQARQIVLATAVARPYLHPPHGKAALRLIYGYPSAG